MIALAQDIKGMIDTQRRKFSHEGVIMGNEAQTGRSLRRLLKPEEAAEYLSVPRWKLYFLARTGELASIKAGRTIRFDQSDLDEFIRTHRRPARGVEVTT